MYSGLVLVLLPLPLSGFVGTNEPDGLFHASSILISTISVKNQNNLVAFRKGCGL